LRFGPCFSDVFARPSIPVALSFRFSLFGVPNPTPRVAFATPKFLIELSRRLPTNLWRPILAVLTASEGKLRSGANSTELNRKRSGFQRPMAHDRAWGDPLGACV
jgi:hypothetical protein